MTLGDIVTLFNPQFLCAVIQLSQCGIRLVRKQKEKIRKGPANTLSMAVCKSVNPSSFKSSIVHITSLDQQASWHLAAASTSVLLVLHGWCQRFLAVSDVNTLIGIERKLWKLAQSLQWPYFTAAKPPLASLYGFAGQQWALSEDVGGSAWRRHCPLTFETGIEPIVMQPMIFHNLGNQHYIFPLIFVSGWSRTVFSNCIHSSVSEPEIKSVGSNEVNICLGFVRIWLC